MDALDKSIRLWANDKISTFGQPENINHTDATIRSFFVLCATLLNKRDDINFGIFMYALSTVPELKHQSDLPSIWTAAALVDGWKYFPIGVSNAEEIISPIVEKYDKESGIGMLVTMLIEELQK